MEEPAEESPAEEPAEEPEADQPSEQAEGIVAEGTCGENLTWVLNDAGTLTISGTGAMDDWGYGESPWNDYWRQITAVIIENGVTTIGNTAFESCDSLVNITIPNSVTSIGDGAFNFCESLASIAIPANVTSMGKNVFKNCDELTEILVDENNQSFTSQDGVLYNKGITTLLRCPPKKYGKLEIPATVTSIEDNACSECKVAEIYFSGSAPSIGDNAFWSVIANVYYPAGDESWTDDIKQDYGGTLIWRPDSDISDVLANGTCGENLTWVLDTRGTLTISGTGAMTDFDAYWDAPWNIYAKSIRTINIESDVTTIGDLGKR